MEKDYQLKRILAEKRKNKFFVELSIDILKDQKTYIMIIKHLKIFMNSP